MNFEYKDYELSNAITDIAAGPFGSNLKVSCFTTTGFPIIDGANLKEITVTDNITKFVPEDKARSLHRSIAKRRDVVVTISGNVGQVSYIPDNSQYAEYLCSQRQFRVTFDESKIYVPYLVYYLHSVEGQSKILAFANQTGVPALSQPLKNFRKIKIDLPSLAEQKKIATILSALDEKIAINRAINENLERQISEIYRVWYQKYVCAVGLPLVESEYGLIPQGWHYSLVGELCKSISISHKFDAEKLIFLNTGDIEDGRFLHANYMAVSDMPGQAKKTILPGDILYSEIRPINKHYAYVTFPSEDYVVSTKLMVIRASGIDSRRLYHYLTTEDVITKLQMEAESRSGTFPQIRFDNISKLPILIADDVTEAAFTTLLHTVYDQIEYNNSENEKLASLRDSLLPRLISGEIDVSAV